MTPIYHTVVLKGGLPATIDLREIRELSGGTLIPNAPLPDTTIKMADGTIHVALFAELGHVFHAMRAHGLV